MSYLVFADHFKCHSSILSDVVLADIVLPDIPYPFGSCSCEPDIAVHVLPNIVVTPCTHFFSTPCSHVFQTSFTNPLVSYLCVFSAGLMESSPLDVFGLLAKRRSLRHFLQASLFHFWSPPPQSTSLPSLPSPFSSSLARAFLPSAFPAPFLGSPHLWL